MPRGAIMCDDGWALLLPAAFAEATRPARICRRLSYLLLRLLRHAARDFDYQPPLFVYAACARRHD